MKKKSTHIIALSVFTLFIAALSVLNCSMAKAAEKTPRTMNGVLDGIGESAGYKKLLTDDFKDGAFPSLTGRFIGIFLGVLGIIFTVLIIYAGYLWFTAEGDATALQKAKDVMMRAVIGLVIVLSAYVITYYITVTLATSSNFFVR